MEINKDNIQTIVKELNLFPYKNLGQNFLIEPSICEQIVKNLNIDSKDSSILEIGPGLGSLTHFILLKSDNVTVVDLDKRMTKFLNEQYSKTSLKVINKDILKTDVRNFDIIVGNLPYYITSDIITYLLINAKKCKRLVCMIQKEAYPRFCAKENEDGYSAIGVLIALLGKISKVRNVSCGAFYPNPKVDSIVFCLDINLLNRNEKVFNIYYFVKALFLNKRKTILNNLSTYLKNKDKALKILEKLGIKKEARPENISHSMYKILYEEVELS